MAGDEAGARANLSQSPDTLAGMAKSKSHQSGEPSVGDMAGDEAEARANLSDPVDTLVGMTNPKSHPSGEPSLDDMASDEAGTGANLSEGLDTFGAMFDSHQSGEPSPEEAAALRRAKFLREAKTAYAAGLARMAAEGVDQSQCLPPDVLFPDEDLYPGGRPDEEEEATAPEQASGEDTAGTPSGGLSPDEARARYEATAAVLAERGLGPGEVIPDCVYHPTASRSDDGRLDEVDVLPEGLEDLPAGPALALLLATVDKRRLNGRDTIRVLRAQRRQISHYQAEEYASMTEAAHAVSADTNRRSPHPNAFAVDEIAAALTYTRRRAENELDKALNLTETLPEVHAALRAGAIDGHKASVIAQAAHGARPAAYRQVAVKILDTAAGLTVGQIKARARRLCIEDDPGYAQTRYEERLVARRVVVEPTWTGTADLQIRDCDPALAQTAAGRVDSIARNLKMAGSTRTIPQLRADVAIDLLTGRHTDQAAANGGKTGSVNLHVDLTTLAGLDDNPAELAGYGPVVADIARQVAEAQQEKSRWDAVVTDPETGEPLHVVSVKRRPTVKQQQMIRALHPVCVFPGCRMPAVNCDLDHRIAHAQGGPTTVENHAPLCRHHHRSKHEAGWSYMKIGRVTVEWVSPTGLTYQTGGNHTGESWTGGRAPP